MFIYSIYTVCVYIYIFFFCFVFIIIIIFIIIIFFFIVICLFFYFTLAGCNHYLPPTVILLRKLAVRFKTHNEGPPGSTTGNLAVVSILNEGQK